MVGYLVLIFVVGLASALAGFIAMERRTVERAADVRLHALAGAVAGLLGIGFASATSINAFDFVALAGFAAAAVAYFGHALASTASVAVNGGVWRSLDRISFANAIWIGAACGFGDVRGCFFVLLVAAATAVFRPPNKSVPAATPGGAATVAGPELAPKAYSASVASAAAADVTPVTYSRGLVPPSLETVFPHAVAGRLPVEPVASEGEKPQPPTPLADAAEQLAVLAKAIRDMTEQTMQARDVFEKTTRMPAYQAYERMRTRQPSHNVAVRHGVRTLQGSSGSGRACLDRALQRANYTPRG